MVGWKRKLTSELYLNLSDKKGDFFFLEICLFALLPRQVDVMLYSYLYNLTGLNVMVSKKRPVNHTPEIKTREGCQCIELE